ncbi:threonine synthase [Pseudomonas sp. A46]|nr:threonine synthase [Pseudomonas sp. A46]OWJ98240.1 threonine synthase [Pseudomonas sp. A46]
MKYVSTRTSDREYDFRQVLLGAYAPDGGLFVPSELPKFTEEQLAKLEWLSLEELAYHILEPFLRGFISADALKQVLRETYKNFKSRATAPLYQTASNEWILELFHGPSGAYQDFGLQLMAGLIEYAQTKDGGEIVIIGCTGGDTGTAAVNAFKDLHNAKVVVLSPEKWLTEDHRKRLQATESGDIQNISVDGDYSDCHSLCEKVLKGWDSTKAALVSFNSVNWVRVLGHLPYLFYSALQLGAPGRGVAFSVPTGNFSALYAGYIAKQMGLPIQQMIVATNINNGLHAFLQSNLYGRTSIHISKTPCMSVSLASNFERFQWSVVNGSGDQVSTIMSILEQGGRIQLERESWLEARAFFDSLSVEDRETFQVIHEVYTDNGYLVSPNTAIGIKAARTKRRSLLIPMICLATTHPANYSSTLAEANVPIAGLSGCQDSSGANGFVFMPNDPSALAGLVSSLIGNSSAQLFNA